MYTNPLSLTASVPGAHAPYQTVSHPVGPPYSQNQLIANIPANQHAGFGMHRRHIGEGTANPALPAQNGARFVPHTAGALPGNSQSPQNYDFARQNVAGASVNNYNSLQKSPRLPGAVTAVGGQNGTFAHQTVMAPGIPYSQATSTPYSQATSSPHTPFSHVSHRGGLSKYPSGGKSDKELSKDPKLKLHSETNFQGNQSRSTDVIFDNEIPVLVRNRDKSERKQILAITLKEKIHQTSHAKELLLQVTDRQDPFFYYSLCLTEDDFQHLKSSQGLLVDFGSFPGMLMQLLEKSLEEAGSSSPTFILVLSATDSHTALEFTELNLFKHLCHLSLIVVKANDAQLKDYLVDCINSLKSELDLRNSSLEVTQRTVEDLKHELGEADRELNDVKKQHQETSSSMNQRLMKELQQEKERSADAISELQKRYEKERREAESRHNKAMEQLENRVASLDVQNRDLLEARYRLESTQREARSRLAAREDEIRRLEAELGDAKVSHNRTEGKNTEAVNRIKQLEMKMESLENDLRNKVREVESLSSQLRLTGDEKARLDRELTDKTKLVSRRESAVRSVTEELVKANEIIRKLQDQLKQEQNKVKLRSKIATEQEKLLGERDKEFHTLRDELKSALEAKFSLQEEMKQLEGKLKAKEDKVEELENLAHTNEGVINWLNKQLTNYKATEQKVLGEKASSRGRKFPLASRKSAADLAVPSINKENEPVVGLDPKYFEHSTPGGSLRRTQIPDVNNLPTNVRRGGARGGGGVGGAGGLLRKTTFPTTDAQKSADAFQNVVT